MKFINLGTKEQLSHILPTKCIWTKPYMLITTVNVGTVCRLNQLPVETYRAILNKVRRQQLVTSCR